MAAYEYDSKDIVLLVGGTTMASFGDNKVTISRNNDVTSLMEGVDGDNMFATSNKKAGTLAFDLIYGTDYDLYMDNLSSYKGLFPVSFIHTKSLKSLVTAGKIQTQADINLGETPEFRTWTLVLDSVDLNGENQGGEFIGAVTEYTA